MAAAAGDLGELDCPVCLDPFDLLTRTPRFLPCHHSLCHSCLHSLIDRRQTQGAIKCPLCQQIALVPREKAFGFQVNFYLERRLAAPAETPAQWSEFHGCHRCTEMHRAEKARSAGFDVNASKGNSLHSLRKSASVVEFATEGHSAERTCSRCRRLSDNSSVSNVHDDVERLQIWPPITPCAKHPREELVLYCKQCKVGICVLCKMTSHESHRSDDLMDVARKARQQLRTDINKLEASNRKLQETIQHTQERKRNYQLKVKVIRDNVVTSKDELHQHLTNKTGEVLERLSALQSSRIQAFDAEEEKLQSLNAKTRNVVTSLTQILDSGSDIEVITEVGKSTPEFPSPSLYKEGCEPTPVLLSGINDVLMGGSQSGRVLDVRKNPTLIKSQRTAIMRLISGSTGVWAVTDTEVRRVGLDGRIGTTIQITGIADTASSPSGSIYLLLNQKGKWCVKSLELTSYLAEFLVPSTAVDRIACCHDNSLVLARTKEGTLSLEYYSKDRKWFKSMQLPWRHVKLDDLVEMQMGRMAVLCHKSEWTSEIIIMDCGGQIIQRFSGNNREGCNVNCMVAVDGGLLAYDVECGHVILLNSCCDILCHVVPKLNIRKWVESCIEGQGICCVRQMALGDGGVLWLLCCQGKEQILLSVEWKD